MVASPRSKKRYQYFGCGWRIREQEKELGMSFSDLRVGRKEAAEYLKIPIGRMPRLISEGILTGEPISNRPRRNGEEKDVEGRQHFRYSLKELSEAKKKLKLIEAKAVVEAKRKLDEEKAQEQKAWTIRNSEAKKALKAERLGALPKPIGRGKRQAAGGSVRVQEAITKGEWPGPAQTHGLVMSVHNVVKRLKEQGDERLEKYDRLHDRLSAVETHQGEIEKLLTNVLEVLTKRNGHQE